MSRRIAPAKAAAAATLPIPVAGILLGVGKNAAYEGADHGDYQTIRIGNRRLALRVPLLQLLGLSDDDPRIIEAFRLAAAEDRDQDPSKQRQRETRPKGRKTRARPAPRAVVGTSSAAVLAKS